jgi:hypothetical protein
MPGPQLRGSNPFTGNHTPPGLSGMPDPYRAAKKGAVAHPLKKKDRSKSQKRLYNFGLLL